LLWPCC